MEGGEGREGKGRGDIPLRSTTDRCFNSKLGGCPSGFNNMNSKKKANRKQEGAKVNEKSCLRVNFASSWMRQVVVDGL